MKTEWTTAVVTIITVEFIGLFISTQLSLNSMGLYNILISFVCFVIGVILALIKKTSTYGKGILIGSGIVMLIGLSICSIQRFY